ncbi:Serine protease, S1-C subfamily, contains C-terminal PDZ domain [Burkholderiales bacterium 8X]|nr:Serine protease, S1-C subfamily, contains C-terminal PDZ domain [Burkholderiales bacterium 8X]
MLHASVSGVGAASGGHIDRGRPWLRWLASSALLIAFAASSLAAVPATPPPALSQDPQEPPAAQVRALKRAGDAVVALRVTATEGATSAESLGVRRSGSGVVIGSDGLILTIGYLLLEAETIEIVTQDNRRLPARQVGYDTATGFGLVRPLVGLVGIEPVPLASGSGLRQGEPLLVAMGSGTGTEVAFTQFVGMRPFSGYWEYFIESALFTSPPVGNHSGAPLFNRDGELLGIGSLLVLEAAGTDTVLPGNMFVPVELLRPVLGELQATGKTRASSRPWLGVSSSEKNGRIQVVRVDRQGPALEAGLKPGDLVLEVDGREVNTLEAFYKQIWARSEPNADVELTVKQGEEVRKITIRAVDRLQTLRKPAGI